MFETDSSMREALFDRNKIAHQMIILNDSILDNKCSNKRRNNKNLNFWDRKKEIQALIQQVRNKKKYRRNKIDAYENQVKDKEVINNQNSKQQSVDSNNLNCSYSKMKAPLYHSRSKEKKRSQTKQAKRWEITLKNPIKDLSPVFMIEDGKEMGNTPEYKDNTFITAQSSQEGKNMTKYMRETKPRVQINVNILKWRLYNINIHNDKSANSNNRSPNRKSKSFLNFDQFLKKTAKFGNNIKNTLRNVILKSDSYRKFMKNTQDIIGMN